MSTQGPRLVLLGKQGAGKGTQAARLAEHYGVEHLSTGELFRASAAEGTPAGLEAKRYMDAGELVPDETVIKVVDERFTGEFLEQGFILDGFPRTTPQAEALDAKLEELGRSVGTVLLIDVSDDEVVKRLGGRRTCEANGHVFHVDFNPPKVDGVCDIDGSPLLVRDDDKPEVIRKRLSTYHDKTEPLIEFYEDQGLLNRVDGDKPPEEVTERIRALLATLAMEEEA